MAENTTAMLDFGVEPSQPETRWFSPYGCVVYYADRVEVFVGGALVASYEPSDRGMRNVMWVILAQEPRTLLVLAAPECSEPARLHVLIHGPLPLQPRAKSRHGNLFFLFFKSGHHKHSSIALAISSKDKPRSLAVLRACIALYSS